MVFDPELLELLIRGNLKAGLALPVVGVDTLSVVVISSRLDQPAYGDLRGRPSATGDPDTTLGKLRQQPSLVSFAIDGHRLCPLVALHELRRLLRRHQHAAVQAVGTRQQRAELIPCPLAAEV